MPFHIHRYTSRTLLVLCAVLAVPGSAFASGDYLRRSSQLPEYRQECGACHTAFPAGMLPAASWQRLMNGLKNHFGTDASLDPATRKQIADWLGANAGTNKRISGEPQEDRITRSTWFTMEHHEVPAATWTLPAVKSASNCSACHIDSAQGDFRERNVKMPR